MATMLILFVVVNAQDARSYKKAVINDPDGYTNVREGKSVNYGVIAKIYENEVFYAYPSTTSNWYPVITKNGTKGYVHNSRISFLSNSNSNQNKPTATSVQELLQGKWQSMDDKTNFIMFEKNERKESSDGMKSWDREVFELSNKCLNEIDKDNGIELEKDKYISCKESDLCWYIVSINNNFLTLSYMGRGNTLKYKRIK